MRFEELAYRKGGADVCVPLHRKLTVVAGLGADARRQWIGRVLGALAGTAAGSDVTLVFADGLGSRVRLARDSSSVGIAVDLETGEDLTSELSVRGNVDWLELLGLDLSTTRALVVMTPEDVRAPVRGSGAPPSAELVEARLVLAGVEEEYTAAASAHRRVEELERRQAELGAAIASADEELARRRYARAVAEVHRLETEFALLTGSDPVDHTVVAAARIAMSAAGRWREAADELHRATQEFGERRRLDERSLERARNLPADVPRGLQELHEAYMAADQRRRELHEALAEHAASDLDPPSAPWVLSVARCDQKDLWDRAEDVLQTRQRASEIAVGLGGAGESGDLVRAIEAAHSEVDEAERSVDNAKVQALAMKGRRKLAKAQERERIVLEQTGFTSYLAFQMRRVDVLIDAGARESFQVAELERQLAQKAWQELAGNVSVDDALGRRLEIERLARHLAALDESTDVVDVLRRELEEEAEPQYAQALAALQESSGVFDVEADHAVSEVAALVFEARTARLQDALDAAVVAHDALYDELEECLAAAGQPGPGDTESRISAAQLLVMEADISAREREAMTLGRDPEEVRAELERARAAASRLGRPGWPARPEVPSGADPDLAGLHDERTAVSGELVALVADVADLPRLNDRRAALRRRVDVLEGDAGAAGPPLMDPQELELYVLGRFASARRVGPEAEPVPMLMDDALVDLKRTDKWRVLDLVARLGEATQVVYLTNDDDAIEWAQQRSAEGTIALVEARDATTARRV